MHSNCRTVRWVVGCFLVLVATVTNTFAPVRGNADESSNDSAVLPMAYLEACTEGNIEYVKQSLKDNPDWLNGQSPQGESCLHLTGIKGQTQVTKFLLEAGADANIRTSFELGQRMTPLTWNVYGGHVENARLLLEHGADVNIDIDWPNSDNADKIATPLDMILEILPTSRDHQPDEVPPELEKYYNMKILLEENGAKRYADLSKATEEL